MAGCATGGATGLAAAVDILRAELATDGTRCCGLAGASADEPRVVHLVPLRCDGGSDIEVEAHDVRRGRESRRRISLADVAPEARPRVVALAVAEMVRGLAGPREVPASRVPEAGKATGPAPVPPVPPVAELALRATLAGATRIYPQTSTFTWGGELGLALDRGSWTALAAAALLGRDHAESAGLVAFRSWWLSVGLARVAAWRNVRLFVGPVVEGGWGTVKGQSREPGVAAHEGQAWLAALGVRAGARAPLGRGWEWAATLGAAGVVRGLDADVDGRRVMAARGLALEASLGVAWGRSLR